LCAKVLQVEIDKTATLCKECTDSIQNVTVKMNLEEEELQGKETENEDLSFKLEQFKKHLDLKRLKNENEIRAKELETKLEIAKKAQKDYYDEQEQLKKDSKTQKFLNMEASIAQLTEQLEMYGQKFVEFEATLNKSNEIFEQFNEREKQL
jgi:chromosome segregation ATPase